MVSTGGVQVDSLWRPSCRSSVWWNYSLSPSVALGLHWPGGNVTKANTHANLCQIKLCQRETFWSGKLPARKTLWWSVWSLIYTGNKDVRQISKPGGEGGSGLWGSDTAQHRKTTVFFHKASWGKRHFYSIAFYIIIIVSEQFALLELYKWRRRLVGRKNPPQTHCVCLGLIMGPVNGTRHRTAASISDASHSSVVTACVHAAIGLMIGWLLRLFVMPAAFRTDLEWLLPFQRQNSLREGRGHVGCKSNSDAAPAAKSALLLRLGNNGSTFNHLLEQGL